MVGMGLRTSFTAGFGAADRRLLSRRLFLVSCAHKAFFMVGEPTSWMFCRSLVSCGPGVMDGTLILLTPSLLTPSLLA